MRLHEPVSFLRNVVHRRMHVFFKNGPPRFFITCGTFKFRVFGNRKWAPGTSRVRGSILRLESVLSLCLWCCLCLWRVPWSVINDVFCAVSLSGTASSPTAAGKAWSQSFCCTCLGRHPFDGEEFLSRTHHGARKMFVNVRVLRQWCMDWCHESVFCVDVNVEKPVVLSNI